jgi:hypothetical protein
METMTIRFDEKNVAFQQWIRLFVTLGGRIIDEKIEY